MSKPAGGVIPKEQLTAFQRWELASFDEAAPQAHAAESGLAEPVPAGVGEIELAALRETAREEGWREGQAQGLAEGRAAIEAQKRDLAGLLAGLRAELSAIPYTLADDTLALALDLAQILVRGAVEIDRERVSEVVNEALAALPRVTQPATLTLHPDDIETVRAALGSDLAGWQLRADPAMQRGGCRVETADSHIDGSIEHRLEKLSVALGQPREWLKAPRRSAVTRRRETDQVV